MRRTFEPVDLMVVVGICATVLGGYLLYMTTSGTIGAATPVPVSIGRTADIMDAMDWVQPALGQAIVDDYLLGREASSQNIAVASEFNRATMIGNRLQNSPFGHFEGIRTHATDVQADHAARVQFVLGRSIIDFTARGVRTGVLPPDRLSGEYNRLMIGFAEATGHQMDEEFQNNHQGNLGWAIVTASQDRARFVDRNQERIGTAVVRVAQLQSGYEEAEGAMQGQVAALAIASIHTEMQADRFARLAAADFTAQQQPLRQTEPRSWPEIPIGVLFAASTGLIGLFLAGLLMPSIRPEAPTMSQVRPEPAGRVYRKTA
ncbi:MAG: hypothetical protein ACREI2_08245 [Nitrospiraceae bacterium]